MDELVIKKGQVWIKESDLKCRITIMELSDIFTVRYTDQADNCLHGVEITTLLNDYVLLGEIVYDGLNRPIQPDDEEGLQRLAEAREVA